jgi:hypothetical protein
MKEQKLLIDSVGTLYALQDLFTEFSTRTFVTNNFLTLSKYGGSTPEAIHAAGKLFGWITDIEGNIAPTVKGRDIHGGNDRALTLRRQLADIIQSHRPPWAAILTAGRKEAKINLPDVISQCLDEAMLLDTTDEEIVNWWDQCAGIMRGEKAANSLIVGRRGERLSLRYETDRTGQPARWQAIESNRSGYDVLSVQDRGSPIPLKIEVKASSRKFKEAEINITTNEWQTALAAPGSYIFHVWVLGANGNQPPALFVLSTETIAAHIPQNSGSGKWTNSAIPVRELANFSDAIFVKS